MLIDILFITLSILVLVSASVMIYAKEPMNSALSFIVTLISIAGLFALLGSTFLFLVQIIIYAGAVIALILFIIMFLNIKDENLPQEPHKKRWIFSTALLITPFTLYLIYTISSIPFKPLQESSFGSIKEVGLTLFHNWVFAFEMISILLLIALVGVVILAHKEEA